MYCQKCGKDAGDAKFCPECGALILDSGNPNQEEKKFGLLCPQCGSHNVSIQTFQENAGSTTITKGKSKYKEKGHGIIWWIFIGSWWWIIDIMLWIFAFPLKLLSKLFRKKKYKGKSTSVSETVNRTNYKTVCTCQACGHVWEKENAVSESSDISRLINGKKKK